MKSLTRLTLAALTLASLTACGNAGTLGSAAPMGAAAALAAKSGDTKADADRKAPPKVEVSTQAKTGTPSRSWTVEDRVRRIAADTLYRYDQLLRDWDAAWGNREKDRIEQRMLEVTTTAIRDIERTTASGYDAEDRRANDRAHDVIERYRALQSAWDRAYSDRERREISNDMLVLLTGSLKDFQRGW